MDKFLQKAANCLLRPLRRGGSFFVFTYGLVLLVLFPVWLLVASGAKVNGWTFVEAFADCYLWAWFLSVLPKRLRKMGQCFSVAVLLFFSVVDLFVKVNFHTFINSAILRLVLETRGGEVLAFLNSYVFQFSTLWVVLPFVLWGGAWLLYTRHLSRISSIFCKIPHRWLASVLFLFVLIGELVMLPVKIRTVQVCSSRTVSDLEVTYGDASVLSLYSPVHRFLFAFRSVQLVQRQIVTVRQLHRDMVVHRDATAVPKVIVVIGESFNRAHSQLYGYSLPTTPFQLQREQRGQLIRFTDVVSCWNLTSYVFQNLMSLHSVDSPDVWENYPLFPAVFKKAGYNVTFLSNQFPASVTGSISSFSGSFFMNDPVLGQQLFDYHNADIPSPVDDANLLSMYDSLKIQSPYELTIFSLVGMHFNYDERIPSSAWNYFDKDLYKFKHLSKQDRQIIADYDNAVRYNDAIMEGILQRFEQDNAMVIYCPDHGEEMFDGTGVWGRTYPEVLSRHEMHNQFEIPLWVWCSDTFQSCYPQKVEQLKAASDLPFMTDDLPHLLLQLSGVSCDALNLRRSPLSDTYISSRKRLLRGWQEYQR